MADVMKLLDDEKTIMGDDDFKSGVKTLVTAFYLLENCLQQVPPGEMNPVYNQLVSRAREKSLKGSDVLMSYFMARMNIPEPVRAEATRVYLQAKQAYNGETDIRHHVVEIGNAEPCPVIGKQVV